LREAAVLGEQLDCGNEFLDILAAALLPLEVISEPGSLGNVPHGQYQSERTFFPHSERPLICPTL
jgi:hypothetical protein